MLEKIENAFNRLTDWVGNLAAAMLIGLVLIMAYNVVGRYLFRDSSLGLEELSWHLYAAIFLLGIPFALRSDSHVRVDLIYERFSERTKAAIDLVGCVIFLMPFTLVVMWTGWQFTASAYQLGAQPDSMASFFNMLTTTGIGERSQDPGGLLNRWLIKGVIPLSFGLLFLSSIAFMIRRLGDFMRTRQTGRGV